MPWTPWIHTEPDDTADERVQELYRRTRNRSTGRPPDSVTLTSMIAVGNKKPLSETWA